ncbi:hypothetical protein DMB41_16425 [Pectobacterium carotovorum subsp. carotovorum]|nr:hypothetical protein DMB41_16425 [Pectobacterium carotovorum subsp. carotovorum]
MSLLPCQWRRIIGTSRPLTSVKCKIIIVCLLFTHKAIKVAVFPANRSHNAAILATAWRL